MNSNKSILYYIAFVLLIILRFINNSILFDLPIMFNYILLVLICSLFIFKIILDKHSIKEYIVFILLSLFSLYIYKVCDVYYFFTSLLSIFAIKDVDIVKVVKIDIFMKLFILFSHSIIYMINYSFNYFEIENLIKVSIKGVSHSLYFTNPNTVGALTVWTIFDIFYLVSRKRKIKVVDLLIGFLFLLVAYLICKSRTPIYIYLIFILLMFIKNDKVLYYLSKYIYFILGGISLFVILFANVENQLLLNLNQLLSNRFMYSIVAYHKYGLALMPNAFANDYVNTLVIDNFYVRCFINYGGFTLLFVGFINLFIPKYKYKMEKKIFILSSIYLFFESITVNTGFAIPLLLIGSIIFNKKEEGIEDEIKKTI